MLPKLPKNKHRNTKTKNKEDVVHLQNGRNSSNLECEDEDIDRLSENKGTTDDHKNLKSERNKLLR